MSPWGTVEVQKARGQRGTSAGTPATSYCLHDSYCHHRTTSGKVEKDSDGIKNIQIKGIKLSVFQSMAEKVIPKTINKLETINGC